MKTLHTLGRVAALLTAIAMLGACAGGGAAPRAAGVVPIAGTGPTHNSLNPNDWRNANARQVENATAATIVDAREIHARAVSSYGTNNLGAGLGAALGALAGSRAGNGTGKLLATVGGALVGGHVGNTVGQAASRQTAVEYIVRTERGQAYSIVQGNQLPLSVGAQVWIIGRGAERSIVPRS